MIYSDNANSGLAPSSIPYPVLRNIAIVAKYRNEIPLRAVLAKLYRSKITRLSEWHGRCSDSRRASHFEEPMLRISEIFENFETVRLRLDGTISEKNFDELQEVCVRHGQIGGRTIIVDMAGVNFMNDAAANRLARLRGKSLCIINCSPFIAALLDAACDDD
jgi:anti-anti-sigma regulatory factor